MKVNINWLNDSEVFRGHQLPTHSVDINFSKIIMNNSYRTITLDEIPSIILVFTYSALSTLQ